jgi:hypothetical protein
VRSPKKSKKSLAMPARIVKNGVILRALGEAMPKFKTRRLCALPLRLLFVLAGASLLMAAFAPSAKASLIAYFNFEDANNGSPPDFTSESDQGLGINTTITTNYFAGNMSTIANFTTAAINNRVAGDIDNPPLGIHSLNLANNSANNGSFFNIPLFSSQGFFSNMTVSFATNGTLNGFNSVQLSYSTNGGATFTAGPSAGMSHALQIISLAVPAAANNRPLLVLRLVFTGADEGGTTRIDNIQVNGTIVPEPATVAGGLLGVLGLGWFQRRRLIRSVRFRRASG